jgi:Pyruvate/2-oxoacid:ferredoxin oxidoreductase gamma subunit
VPAEAIEAAIEHEFCGDKARFAAANTAAFRAGLEQARKALQGSSS